MARKLSSEHLRQLAELIAKTWNPEDGTLVTEMLTTVYQFDIGKHRIESLLRFAVIDEMAKSKDNVPCIIEQLLKDVGNPSLLHSSLLLFQSDLDHDASAAIIRCLWKAFIDLIAQSFIGDPFITAMIGCSHGLWQGYWQAKMIRKIFSDKPLRTYIQSPKAGVLEANAEYYLKQKNIVLYLIVSAMASEWLMKPPRKKPMRREAFMMKYGSKPTDGFDSQQMTFQKTIH